MKYTYKFYIEFSSWNWVSNFNKLFDHFQIVQTHHKGAHSHVEREWTRNTRDDILYLDRLKILDKTLCRP